ncbi:hypothetical protein [Mycoplasma feriruminatoris]|uniref:hypothetical protein n=1 Tax=Mycoplasma feriruminatoris TaxID=1179777 RepID=UPI00241CFDC3|nr:hypothetical protein [Mycoplasma feriruminatoris]
MLGSTIGFNSSIGFVGGVITGLVESIGLAGWPGFVHLVFYYYLFYFVFDYE